MLTATPSQTISETNLSTQNETTTPDHEIARRVLAIRSNWNLSERIARREEAERRFSDLLDALTSAHAA